MELTLFGGFQLVDDAGNAVELSARKAKALLAWLALHQDQRHTRDRLALLLWEDSGDAQARHSLRQALSGLRKALGKHAEALIADQQTVRLDSGHILADSWRFEALLNREPSGEALSQAVSLYGGEFLEGFNPRSNTYEEWLMTQRSHYRERAMGAMSSLLEHYLKNRQLESGMRLAIRMLSGDPLQERVYRTLMRIYARLNRPAEALRQYRQCRRVLFRELGLAPEPETVRLYQEIAQARTRQNGEIPAPENVYPSHLGFRISECVSRAPGQGAATSNCQSYCEERQHRTGVRGACSGAKNPGVRGIPAPQSTNETEDGNTPGNIDTPAVVHEGSAQLLRLVTVVHIYLGRYLELVSQEDPERFYRCSQELLQQVEQLAHAYGGHLHHQHTDAITILFGLPAAHGNECEKAVQMALELRDKTVADEGSAADRFGIQTGIVSGSVVYDGKNVASGTVFVEAEHLARSGTPRDVLLSEISYRGIRLSVEASRIDDTTWRVLNISADAASGSRTSPFVGRKRELRQFGTALEACTEDRTGETFLLRGEAGIGKTRLVEEISKQAEPLGVACHCAQVLDFGMESRTGPIPSLLRQLLFSDQACTTDEIEVHAKACLGNAWNEALHPHAVRLLFRLPLTRQDSGPQESLAQETIRLGSQQLMRGILESTCRSRPRLLVVEDVHWADQRTLALLADLADIVSRCAALLVITSRVEGEPLDPGWRSAMHWAPLTTMDVGPLGKAQALILAGQLTDNDTGFIHRCIERSGGNPFFLEQLLWGTVSHEGTVPDSVQNLVLTRLDMLPEVDRLAAQAASALGQGFRLAALRQLIGRPDALLSQRLIRPEGEGFLFGHALLRDSIYTSLLRTRRRSLHLKAAEWYHERDPALHARHLDLADDMRAAEAYLQAAQLAIPAYEFEQALDLVNRGAEIAQGSELNAQLNTLRGDLLIQAGDIEAANRAFAAAADSATDGPNRCRALIGMAAGLTVQDNLDEALEILDRAAPLAKDSGNDMLQTEFHYRRGDILFALARTDECLYAHKQAERLARQSNAPLLEIRALAELADAYYARGRMKTAKHHFDRCIELARREKRLPQELGNLSMRGLTHFYAGTISDALADVNESAKFAAEYGNLRAEMAAYVNFSLISLYTEDVVMAEQAGRRGLELARQLGVTRFSVTTWPPSVKRSCCRDVPKKASNTWNRPINHPSIPFPPIPRHLSWAFWHG